MPWWQITLTGPPLLELSEDHGADSDTTDLLQHSEGVHVRKCSGSSESARNSAILLVHTANFGSSASVARIAIEPSWNRSGLA